MVEEIIKLTIPNKPDYISIVRLTTSAICSNIGLNIEDIEDMKVCISEACINALCKSDEVSIEFQVKTDRLIMKVNNVSVNEDKEIDLKKEIDLGILIIESLMDDVNFTEKGVEMIKHIEDGNR